MREHTVMTTNSAIRQDNQKPEKEAEIVTTPELSADERSILFTQTDIENKDIQLIDRFR